MGMGMILSSKPVRRSFNILQVVSAVSLIVALWSLHTYNRRTWLRDEQTEHHRVFAMMNQVIQSFIESNTSMIEIVTPDLERSDSSIVRLMKRYPAILAMYDVDPGYRIRNMIYTGDHGAAYRDIDLSSTRLAGYIREAATSQTLIVTPVMTSFITGRESMIFIRPEPGHVYLVEQDFTQIASLIERTGMDRIYSESIVLLLKKDSDQILYNSARAKLPYWELPVERNHLVSIQNKSYYIDRQFLDPYGLQVVVMTPTQYFFNMFRTSLYIIVMILMMMLVYLGLMNYWVGRTLIRPLTRFNQAIAMGLKDPATDNGAGISVQSTHREWIALETVYNEMVGTLSRQVVVNRELGDSLRQIMDATPDGLLVGDENGFIVSCNETAVKLFRIPADELRTRRITEVIPQAPGSDLETAARLSIPRVYEYETELTLSDDATVPVQIRVAPILIHTGLRTLFVITDITERRESENALIASEERFRSILMNAPTVAVQIYDENGKTLFWNPASTTIFGYTEEEIVGSPIDHVLHKKRDVEVFYNIVHKVKQSQSAFGPFEWTLTHRDGSRRVILFSLFPLATAETEKMFVCMIIDITSRREAEEALRESERRMRQVIDSSPFGAHLFKLLPDGSLVLTGFNRSAERILLNEHATLLNQKIEDAFPSSTDNQIRDKYRDIARNGGAYNQEWVEYDDGAMHRIFDVHSFNTGPGSVCVFFMDVTERRLAEEKLAEVRAIMDAALANAPMGLMVFAAPDFKLLSINRAACETLSLDPERDYFGEPIPSLRSAYTILSPEGDVIPDDRYPTTRVIRFAESMASELYQIRRQDGQSRWVLANGAPIYNAEGKMIAGVLGFPDISALRLAEEALAREKETLTVTLRSIGDGVIATDTGGRVTLLNREAETMTGWSSVEAEGKPLEDIFHIVAERNRIPGVNPVDMVLRSGQIEGLANGTVLIARDGTERMIADSAAPIRDRDSKIRGVVLVFRDITAAHVMEMEIQKAQKLESVGVLAGGIAHDFNNILMAILGNISMAKYMEEGNEKVVQMLLDAEKACLRARGLTQQLLTFAKGGNPVKEATPLPDLIRESAEFILTGSNVSCSYRFAHDLLMADIDSGQISQVIQNLVLNAKQAMPNGGMIEIRAENERLQPRNPHQLPEGEYLRLSVRDYGIGITPENLSRIFDPYFTTKETGSGLGLSVSYSVIRKHDGALVAESTPGDGSCFTIYLPAIDQEFPSLAENTDQFLTGSGEILLMEDEKPVQEVAARMIERFGYQVFIASHGEQALKMYRDRLERGRPYDLVIMDLTIRGGMGGLEASQRMRALNPDVKVVVSSGYSNDPVMGDPIKFGFLGAIPKPYKMMEMSRVIHDLIYPEKEI
jgi:PAS domain S-box-containing protein